MERTTRLAIITVLLVGLELTTLFAQARAEGLQETRARTLIAIAQFRTPHLTDPCVETGVDIAVVDSWTKGDLGNSSGVSTLIEIHQSNHCAAIPLFGMSVRPADVTFRGGDGLASATLTGVTSGTDFVSGQTFVLAFAVVWEATGERARERSHEIVTVDGCSAHVRLTGSVRPAIAFGTVSIPGVNFTPTTTEFATLSSEKGGVQTIGDC